ncbi:hypothetical protein ACFVRR_01030 [Gottfriedia sp. NPDC057948]|uniref:hypothetical protein n=1 Tax=Gottfriedia sp. NPDC057948 TaxID=3346287 RepID=UPI0036D7A8FA
MRSLLIRTKGTTLWNFRKDVVTGGDFTLYAKWTQKSLASYYKIRAYKMVGSKKIYGDFTGVISIKM